MGKRRTFSPAPTQMPSFGVPAKPKTMRKAVNLLDLEKVVNVPRKPKAARRGTRRAR